MKISGAEIIIRSLIDHNVDAVFGYPGGQVLNIYDELYKAQDKITHYITSHEQGASHAADGYARASGKTGVVIATSGPGATNLVTGIATAYLDSVPMVAITGNVAQALIGRDSFQEVDIKGITMPVTKHNYMVKDINSLAGIIAEAFYIANSGRPGPVLIDVPKDIQVALCEYEKVVYSPPVQAYKNGSERFSRAAAIISESERPFIYAGGGVIISGAERELIEFADKIDAPIGSSMMGITAASGKTDRFLGMTGMHGKFASSKAMSEADLIIAVGTRFSDRATGNKVEFISGKKFLHIDIDPAEIGKNISSSVYLVGDIKYVLTRLAEKLSQRGLSSWHSRVQEIKSSPDSRLQMPKDTLNPQTALQCARKFMDDADAVATDVGQHQMWTAQYYNFSAPRTFITSGGLGTMGYGMGAAIGACIGRGKKRTLLVTSDGSFHMNLNELATVVTNNLPVVIAVLNNNALGMVRQWQTLFFDKRYSQTSLERVTDFVKVAEAFGAKGERISDLSELEPAMQRAFAAGSPYLLDIIIGNDEKVLPMIPPGGTINDIILKN